MEELPNYFDIIVIGTGMPECIIAAAAARVGKSVLHLERNGYYGGDWASFTFDKFLEWIEDTKNMTQSPADNHSLEDSLMPFLNENERLVLCNLQSNSISNLSVKSYISETVIPVTSPEQSIPSLEDNSLEIPEDTTSDVNDNENPEDGGTSESTEQPSESGEHPSESGELPSSPPVSIQQEWTISQFIENRRKFNIDLSPKLLFSRGSLVELLVSSNIARYAEFQCVNRVLTYINGHIEQVPCSRADVFSTRNVNVVEKRMLMQFLTFCLAFEERKEEYQGFETIPFSEFLKSKRLTSNVQHYIMHAIAMVDESCSTLEGLKSTQKFLQSLGRYGKSPFLCTCYGSAELPQCFCRLCAVYGGLYYLKRNVEAVVLNNRSCGIISRNQRIGCRWLIMESSYSPREFLPLEMPQRISKAILVTSESLYPSERKENILLKLPPGTTDNTSAVTVLEFSSKTYVCPEDLYIVYMFCHSAKYTAEDDLMSACELLFKKPGTSDGPLTKGENSASKPTVLWCTFFNQTDTSTVELNSRVPEGLFITASPDVELDYEHAVKEAKTIFERMCPGEEFLPRAPDPEDILIERHNNADEEGEKVENDVSQAEQDSEVKNTLDIENNEENASYSVEE